MVLKLFNSEVSDKKQGWNTIAYVFLPVAVVQLFTLYMMCKLTKRCLRKCCGGKRITTSKVTTPTHPPKPSSRERREKVE